MPKLLIVEDDPIICFTLSHHIEQLMMTVCASLSMGEDVLKAVELHLPDLVLMDINLKGNLDGIDAATQLAQMDYPPPVIFLTAFDDEPTLKRATEKAPYGYILKPFNKRELQVSIESSLQRAAMERRLKQSENRLKTTLKSIGEAIVILNNNLQIEFTNFLFERLIRKPPEACLGKNYQAVFQLEQDGMPSKLISRCLSEGCIIELDSTYTLVSESIVPASLEGAKLCPIINDRGKTEGVLFSID